MSLEHPKGLEAAPSPAGAPTVANCQDTVHQHAFETFEGKNIPTPEKLASEVNDATGAYAFLISQFPSDAFFQSAKPYVLTKKWDQLKNALLSGKELGIEHRYFLGMIFREMQMLEEASREFEKAMRKNPSGKLHSLIQIGLQNTETEAPPKNEYRGKQHGLIRGVTLSSMHSGEGSGFRQRSCLTDEDAMIISALSEAAREEVAPETPDADDLKKYLEENDHKNNDGTHS